MAIIKRVQYIEIPDEEWTKSIKHLCFALKRASVLKPVGLSTQSSLMKNTI